MSTIVEKRTSRRVDREDSENTNVGNSLNNDQDVKRAYHPAPLSLQFRKVLTDIVESESDDENEGQEKADIDDA